MVIIQTCDVRVALATLNNIIIIIRTATVMMIHYHPYQY